MSTTRRKRSPAEVVQLARQQVEELFGKPVDAVAGVARNGQSGWVVTLEVVELPRIPDTTSLVGLYEAKLDGNCDLVEAKRLRRYSRNQTDPLQRRQEGDE